jgi:hypothetical protein
MLVSASVAALPTAAFFSLYLSSRMLARLRAAPPYSRRRPCARLAVQAMASATQATLESLVITFFSSLRGGGVVREVVVVVVVSGGRGSGGRRQQLQCQQPQRQPQRQPQHQLQCQPPQHQPQHQHQQQRQGPHLLTSPKSEGASLG